MQWQSTVCTRHFHSLPDRQLDFFWLTMLGRFPGVSTRSCDPDLRLHEPPGPPRGAPRCVVGEMLETVSSADLI